MTFLPVGFHSNLGSRGGDVHKDKSPPVRVGHTTSNSGQPPAVCYDMRGNGDGKTSNTLTGDHANRPTDYTPVVCVNAREDPIAISGKSLPLGAKDIGHAVSIAENQRGELRTSKMADSLNNGGGKPGQGYPAVLTHAVRRLTPTECERLQGFSDGWTQVPYRNKPAADGPRYKALGNAMAVPLIRWLGERIGAQYER